MRVKSSGNFGIRVIIIEWLLCGEWMRRVGMEVGRYVRMRSFGDVRKIDVV